MEPITNAYRKLYAAIEGRSRRRDFWIFTLYFIAVTVVVYAILLSAIGFNAATFARGQVSPAAMLSTVSVLFVTMVPFMIWYYPTALAHLALTCRRMHDQNRSAWWLLLGIIPLFGFIIILIFMCTSGTVGPNRYGADPKNPYDSDVFS